MNVHVQQMSMTFAQSPHAAFHLSCIQILPIEVSLRDSVLRLPALMLDPGKSDLEFTGSG